MALQACVQPLRFPPWAVTAVFAQVLHDKARVLSGFDGRLTVPKPKALRELPHERTREV